MSAHLPRTIIPTGLNDVERMHRRTHFLTRYVEDNIARKTRIKLGDRMKLAGIRSRGFEATLDGADHSFLIVPAANGWANVSDSLESVRFAIIVTFDVRLSDLGRNELPSKLRVYSVDAAKMLRMKPKVIKARGSTSRSQSVSVPVFKSVLAAEPDNKQCAAGALDGALLLLWEEDIKWAKNERELSYRPDPAAQLLDVIASGGQRLRIQWGDNVMLLDPSTVTMTLE